MILLLLGLANLAYATSSFDPTTPAAAFEGDETYTQDGATKLWGRIERIDDPDASLFSAEAFNAVTAWPSEGTYTPWIADCFGTTEPSSGVALLHMGVHEATASGTPVLFVPGAGDNASRGFIAMATHMDEIGRPAYALTFAHPHGDSFMQAEIVADAISRIRERTGAAQVDVVSHSKGGISTAIYLSNADGADWGDDAYEAAGTTYRGDVRRAVFIATPLGGIDSGYRWSAMNYASLTADYAISPSSWSTYYPYTTAFPTVQTDLSEQDFLPDDGDLFPGQRQLLARQDYTLPGELPALGVYAVQQDWYTTYEGGYGYYSWSAGIDAAVAAGGDLVARLEAQGADPDVEIFLLAGDNPIMPNGSEDLLAEMFGDLWVELATAPVDVWAAFLGELIGDAYIAVGISEEEIAGLASGKLILGEVTGPSDGLVFTTSATKGEALDARGAVIVEEKVVSLSHLDLLYASPVTGELLIAEGEADPLDDGWKVAVGERYAEADTIGWVEEVLADDAVVDTGDEGGGEEGDGEEGGGEEGDGGEGGVDTGPGDTGPGDTGAGDTDGKADPGCGCAAGGRGVGWLGLVLAVVAVGWRRSRCGC